jgi:hypothetical protein
LGGMDLSSTTAMPQMSSVPMSNSNALFDLLGGPMPTGNIGAHATPASMFHFYLEDIILIVVSNGLMTSTFSTQQPTTNGLNDLLGLSTPSMPVSSSTVSSDADGIRLTFERAMTSPAPGSELTILNVHMSNTTAQMIEQFVFQAAVTKVRGVIRFYLFE